jgi:diguanylate cyclase (GGDEF)-like protein
MRARDENRKQMAYTAAAMYGGATVVGLVEQLIPGGQSFSILPGVGALTLVIALLAFGPRFPIWALAALGPIGAALIAAAVATTEQPGDAAVLYAWPVLWFSFYFGFRGAIAIVVWVGIVHGCAVLSLDGGARNLDRWLDVMVSMTIVAGVVEALAQRNRELLAKLVHDARTDQLTGLLNRRGFDELVPHELARARREGSCVGVVTFDIDHFKRINDEWGHEAGDRVLAALADVFRAETRSNDVVARMGGEEFTAVLEVEDIEGAVEFAERVRAAFAGVDVGVGHATISAGITAARRPGAANDLLLAADAALYQAKVAGRDRAVVSDGASGSNGHRGR